MEAARSARVRCGTAEVSRRRSAAIARALRTITSHPHVEHVGERRDMNGGTVVDIRIRLNLPSRWAAAASSPNGVRRSEPVMVVFGPTFPRTAPKFYARADFDRGLAHVQPGPASGPVEPCISESNPTELFHQLGLNALIDHLVEWFDKAASGTLIDPQQGWEPVRRDTLRSTVIADVDHIRALVKNTGSYAVFSFDYLRLDSEYIGEVGRQQAVAQTFSSVGERRWKKALRGAGIALAVWPNVQFVCDKYHPETIVDLESLVERARLYGCEPQLRAGIAFVQRQLGASTAEFGAVILLCARRPFHLIGSDSGIEVSPYIVSAVGSRLFPNGDRTPVEPTSHRHAVTPRLLRSMSGDEADLEPPNVALIGCGSLGSKIALHLARRGTAPHSVIDRASLSPHNAARHGLIPSAATQLLWWSSKATALAEAIGGFGQQTRAENSDVAAADETAFARLVGRKAQYIVNTTATLTAAEALARKSEVPARIIDCAIMNGGALGTVTIEGDGRNPDITDLMTETYRRLASHELTDNTAALRIGEGCSSVTMRMSDARISMFAAPMSELVSRWTKEPPKSGVLMVARVSDDGLSVLWESIDIGAATIVRAEGANTVVRIAENAARAMTAEVARWPKVETGGVLMGRYSEATDTFYVSDVLDAPPDSTRSAGEFVLGTKGLSGRISEYVANRRGSLYCLGTWHSHLRPEGPSGTDRNTATILAHARITPTVMLIHTPAGFRALLATTRENS